MIKKEEKGEKGRREEGERKRKESRRGIKRAKTKWAIIVGRQENWRVGKNTDEEEEEESSGARAHGGCLPPLPNDLSVVDHLINLILFLSKGRKHRQGRTRATTGSARDSRCIQRVIFPSLKSFLAQPGSNDTSLALSSSCVYR